MVVLWPLAQTEIEGSTSNLVDHLFDMRPPTIRDAPVGPAAWVGRAVLGGFPGCAPVHLEGCAAVGFRRTLRASCNAICAS